jgi:oxygen-dependent protoporphyrinogen oxidase
VGAIVQERLGRPIVERLVDPLVGGIHAGDVDELSAAATFPYLLAASIQSGSLMRRLRRRRQRPPDRPDHPGTAPEERAPLFWSLPNGVAGLADALEAELIRRGVTITTGVSVEAIDRWEPDRTGAGRWRLDLRSDRHHTLIADGLVLAVPARETAVLLAAHAPEAAGLLSTIEYASVAVVTLAFPKGAIRASRKGTGVLVPRTATLGGARSLVTAVTYLDRKWPHLARRDDDLIRASVGRFGDLRHQSLDDDELRDAVLSDLALLLGVHDRPVESLVTRWDGAFPQYQVGHLILVGRIEQDVATLAGIEVAGAAYRGVGIPACIGGGRAAARRLLGSLSSPGPSVPSEAVDGRPL